MNLRVNHEDINNYCDVSNMCNDEINENIDFWLDKIDELKEIWQGDDADQFIINSSNYIKRMKIITECNNSITSFVTDANKEYRNVDNEGKLKFEKESYPKDGDSRV